MCSVNALLVDEGFYISYELFCFFRIFFVNGEKFFSLDKQTEFMPFLK